MEATFAYAVWLLCVCSLGNVFPVDSSHFMGGIIRWKSVNPAAFDGIVQITHRIAWRRDRNQGGRCTQATIDAQTLLPSGGQLTCQSGCSGTIGDFSYYCTDFSVTDNWSAGERTYTYNFTEASFEAAFASNAWISLVTGSSRWELRVRGNLTYREDTGLVNSPPVVNIPPLIRMQQGCSHTIKIPVEDADGDPIRCRWAESSLNECGGVCRRFPANLNQRDCEIEYTGSYLSTGDYAVALQVEDFVSSTATTPLSSVPIQFIVRVRSFLSNSCTSKPELVGDTPLNGSYFGVSFNTSWYARIITRVSTNSTATSITEFVTASPFGMRKFDFARSENPGEWQVIVSWTPAEFQFGPNIFCYAAMDNEGLQSTQRCVVLLACNTTDPEPPMVVPSSMSPTGEVVFNQSLLNWSISTQFDKPFTRPTRNSYIRVFGEGGDEVVTINVRTSAAVIYPSDALGRTLIFDVNICQLPISHTFYILLDAGVAVGTEPCHAESPPLTDPTVWTFMTAEHIDTYATDFTTVEYTTMHTTNIETTEHTDPVTTEHTETLEFEIPEYTDTNGQMSTTAPSVNTEPKTEKSEVRSVVCLANSVVITVCTLLSLTFLFGVICGLIAECCVCALLKRKAKQQNKVSLKQISERNDHTDHYEISMGESGAELETSADIYDEITPDCKPGIGSFH